MEMRPQHFHTLPTFCANLLPFTQICAEKSCQGSVVVCRILLLLNMTDIWINVRLLYDWY